MTLRDALHRVSHIHSKNSTELQATYTDVYPPVPKNSGFIRSCKVLANQSSRLTMRIVVHSVK